MDWIASALSKNFKRQQLQANERLVAGDGFMLNLVSVLQHLCGKTMQDMVDPNYLHIDTTRVDITDESRHKASKREGNEFCGMLEKGKVQIFPSDCLNLALQAHRIGIMPILKRW